MSEDKKSVQSKVYAHLKELLAKGSVFLSAQKHRVLKTISLPYEYISDLEAFVKRNSIYGADTEHGCKAFNAYCPQCLKAYALQRAKEMKLDEKQLTPFITLLDCQTGHNGYYADGDRLAAIS